MKFLRQLFNRNDKHEEILVPEAELLAELGENQVETTTHPETSEDDEDTIAPTTPDPDQEDGRMAGIPAAAELVHAQNEADGQPHAQDAEAEPVVRHPRAPLPPGRR